MVDIGKRLRQAREAAGLSGREAARRLGLPHDAVGKWERGDVKPEIEDIKKAAALYSASFLWLIGESETPEPVGLARVPLLGTIRAGIPVLEQEDRVGEVTVSPELGADFALRVRGDSMEPELRDGDLVLLRQVHGPDPSLIGEVVAALVNGGEVTLKRLVRDADRWILRAANSAYPDIPLTSEEDRIQGVMVGFQRGKRSAETAPRGVNRPVAPSDWQSLAERLAKALEMREENERLRIQQVDAVRAQAEKMAQENVRIAMEEMRSYRHGVRLGQDAPREEAATAEPIFAGDATR